jgi:hypothetical protein
MTIFFLNEVFFFPKRMAQGPQIILIAENFKFPGHVFFSTAPEKFGSVLAWTSAGYTSVYLGSGIGLAYLHSDSGQLLGGIACGSIPRPFTIAGLPQVGKGSKKIGL